MASLQKAAKTQAGKAPRSPLEKSRQRWGALFIAPQLVSLLLFGLVPVAIAFVLGLFDWNGFRGAIFVGFDNFVNVFSDKNTFTAIKNTFLFAVLYAPLLIILALLLSLLLNKAVGKLFYRSALFLPQVVSSVAIAAVWSWIFQPQIGILNVALEAIGISGQDWLGNPKLAMGSIVAMSIWWGLGYNIVLFLAGLQNVPRSYVEAAMIDGASPRHVFWHITLPLISPTTLFVTITTMIDAFQAFDQMQLLTYGGPVKKTWTLTMHIYDTAFKHFRLGEASAIALILFVIVVAASVAQYALSEKYTYYGD